ncbi:MAG: PilZ domain-containing protein [Tissierellia bacterium]|nr:PilZ domain-containing protein [Tissierellia bacterium]
MNNTDKTVKIYDSDKNLIGKGHLLDINNNTIKVKGHNLPILNSKKEIIIEIYHEFSGINAYYCDVSVAASNQLNANIKRSGSIIERRKSLKVRTDLSFYIDSLWRNDKDITKDVPNMKINMLNLSIGGMLISSNYNLKISDIITFNFQYEKPQVVLLKAKIIRIDKIYDEITRNLSILNYGCSFDKLSSFDEAVITKYLYDRQLQLYRNK